MSLLHTMRHGPQDGLNQLVRDWLTNKYPLLGIEIGCYAGESAEIFLSSGSFCYLACIDPWEQNYDPDDTTGDDALPLAEEAFDRRFAGNHVVVKFKMKSDEAALIFEPSSMDFLYIDGNHQYDFVMSDLKNYVPKVRKGGIIAGHDYNEPTRPGVTKAVLEFFGGKSPRNIYPDHSWVYVKE